MSDCVVYTWVYGRKYPAVGAGWAGVIRVEKPENYCEDGVEHLTITSLPTVAQNVFTLENRIKIAPKLLKTISSHMIFSG